MADLGELYLILHKVRGEPAFDIAECIGEDGDGEIWIIPTSGHRCYPLHSWSLPEEAIVEAEGIALPDEWPVHYTCRPSDEGYGHKELRKFAVEALLTRLGRSKPKLIRRPVR